MEKIWVQQLIRKLENTDIVFPMSQKMADRMMNMYEKLATKKLISRKTYNKEMKRIERTSLDDGTMALFKRAIVAER